MFLLFLFDHHVCIIVDFLGICIVSLLQYLYGLRYSLIIFI